MTVEWFGAQILKNVKDIVSVNEKESAERVEGDAKRYCPVGKWERTGGGTKTWKARKPGSLKNSIKAYKSKYQNGGWIVMAGNDDVFYARFVELGTPKAMTRRGKRRTPIPKFPFLRRAKIKEERRFYSILKGLLT